MLEGKGKLRKAFSAFLQRVKGQYALTVVFRNSCIYMVLSQSESMYNVPFSANLYAGLAQDCIFDCLCTRSLIIIIIVFLRIIMAMGAATTHRNQVMN